MTGAQDQRGASHPRSREDATPHREFDDLPVDRHPLRLDRRRGLGGQQITIQSWAELDAGWQGAGEFEGPVERGGPVGWVGEARSTRSSRGIEPHRTDAGEIRALRVPELDTRRLERCQVEARDGGGDLIALHRQHTEVEGRHGQGITPDSAAEVGDHVDAGPREATGVQRGDAEPGGLLEAFGSEQHPARELAELGLRFGAKPRLTEHRCHDITGMPGCPQARDDPDDIHARLDRSDLVEKPQPLGREQRAQLGDIHPAHATCSRPAWAPTAHDRPQIKDESDRCSRIPHETAANAARCAHSGCGPRFHP